MHSIGLGKLVNSLNNINTFEKLAKLNASLCAIWIKYSTIQDQGALIRIARLALEKGAGWVSSRFERFAIEDEDERIELFKFATRSNSKAYEYVARYKIHTEKKRIALAKWLVQQGCTISSNIEDFQITSPKVRMELAMEEATIENYTFSNCIQFYHIESEDDRMKLAMIYLVHSSYSFCFNFKNFNISKESNRIKLAQLALEHLGINHDFGDFIDNFEISSELERIKLANRAAERGILNCLNNIHPYKIANEIALYEIAKSAAFSSPEITAATFYKYRIMDEKKRIYIAKIIACLHGRAISKHIHQFCIQNQIALEVIALLAAANDGKGTSEYFNNYGLTEEKARINVALSIGADVLEFLHNFNILDRGAKDKIIYYVASAPLIAVRDIFQRDTIPPEMSYEIGKIFARTKSVDTAANLQYFKQNNPKEILEIVLICIRYSVESIKLLQHNDFHMPSVILQEINDRENFAEVHTKLTSYCRKYIDENSTYDLLQSFEVSTELLDERSLANWKAFTAATCVHYELKPQDITRLVKGPFFNAIVKFPDEQMRYKLIDLAVRLTQSGDDEELLTNLYQDGPEHILLPLLVIFSLKLKNDDPFLFKNMITHLQHKEYTDPQNNKFIVRGLYRMMCDYDFTKSEYLYLFRYIFRRLNPKESIEKIRIIESIHCFDGTSKLTNEFKDLLPIQDGTITVEGEKIFYLNEYVPNHLVEKLMKDKEATSKGVRAIIYGLTFGFQKNASPFRAGSNDWNSIITRIYPEICEAPESFFHKHCNEHLIKMIQDYPSTIKMTFGPPDVFLKIENKLLPVHKEVLKCYGELAGHNYLSIAVSGTFKSKSNIIDLDYTGELPDQTNVLEPSKEILVPSISLTYRGVALVLLRFYGYGLPDFQKTFNEEILQANNYFYPGIDNLKLSSILQDARFMRTLYDLHLKQLINTMIAKVRNTPNYTEIAEELANFYFAFPLANQEDSFCQLEHMCGKVFDEFKKAKIRFLGGVQNLRDLVLQKFFPKLSTLSIIPQSYAKRDIEVLLHYCESEAFPLGGNGRKQFRDQAFYGLRKHLSKEHISYNEFEDILTKSIYYFSWAQIKAGFLTPEENATIENFVTNASQKLPTLMLVGDENFRLKKSITDKWAQFNKLLGTSIPFVINFG